MIYNKDDGYWNAGEKCSYLDNLAYYLYVSEYCNWVREQDLTNQPMTHYIFILQHADKEYSRYIEQYYNKALSIIRKEKLEKINEKIL